MRKLGGVLAGVLALGCVGFVGSSQAHVGGMSLYDLKGVPVFVLAHDLMTSTEAREKTVKACVSIINGTAELQYYYRKQIKKSGVEGFCFQRYNERVNDKVYLSLGSTLGKKPNKPMTGYGMTAGEAKADMQKKCPECEPSVVIELLSCVETPDYLETQKSKGGVYFMSQTAEKSCKEKAPQPNVSVYTFSGGVLTATRVEDFKFPEPVKLTPELIAEFAKGTAGEE